MIKYVVSALFYFSLSCCAANPVINQPQVKVVQSHAFSDIQTYVAQKVAAYSAKNVLVVVDIDNTLLTSSSDLGGDIWYQWQRANLAVKPREEQKVMCLFEDSISLLYELSPMTLTEQNIPTIIQGWQNQAISLFALTSRSPINRAATERELKRAHIDMSLTALGKSTTGAPVLRNTDLQREMSYMQGIMMTSGMNKGEMLHYLLAQYKQQFDAIIFVDDSQKNVDNLLAAFNNPAQFDMTIFHYTKVEDDRINQQGSVLTQAQADEMAKQWQTLNQTLDKLFPARRGDTCLNAN